MSGTAPAVLLMAETSTDAERYPELGGVLLAQAESVGRAVAGDGVRLADRGEGLSDAVSHAYEGHDGPLLVVWPSLPRLTPQHAAAAWGDLTAGCDLVLGPVIDGGLYLLGLAEPLRQLAVLPGKLWQGPDVVATGLAAARDAGLEVGILRAERALRSSADIEAARADPLLPEQIRRILGGAAPGRP